MNNPFAWVMALALTVPTISFSQTVIGFEDFDGGSVNLDSTTNVSDYGGAGGSGGDVFGTVNGQLGGNGMPFDVADDTAVDVSGARAGSNFPADQLGIAGENTTAFFAVNDADAVGVNNAVWTFTGWGSATITDILIDIAAMGDFEAGSSDGFLIEAAINGGTFQEIFRAATNEAAFKTYRPLDGGFVFADDDPLELFIDGSATPFGFLDKCVVATGNFDTYTSTLFAGQVATALSIRISWSGSPSGSEPMGMDNITIRGTASTPELVISEIMYNPNSSEDTWEWVEVYNEGAAAVDLAGFVIDDINGVAHGSSNIASGTIPAGGSAILYNSDDLLASDFMAAWGTVNLIAVTNWGAMALNNGGDTVGIWESFSDYSGDHQTHANTIDSVPYDDSGAWPVDNNSASIFLNDLAADNDLGGNWTLSTDGGATPLFNGYTSLAAGGNSGNDVGSPGTPAGGIMPLLISEVTVTPTAGEFIEIYNPNAVSVDLEDVYLTDATFAGGGTFYYNIVTGTNAGGGGFGDFLARFPAGSSIAPGEYQTVSISGSDDYFATYAANPTYELYEDGGAADGIPDMLEGLPGSINGQGGLTNGGEVAILFYWDGASDLVSDLDYVVWGDKAEAVDKTGVSIDGPDADATPSTYANDTAIVDQEVVAASSHAIGDSFQRSDLLEGTEVLTGGNGVSGHDETSENLSSTFCNAAQTQGAANVCGPVVVPLSFIHEVQGSGPTSPVAGSTVRVTAIVVADYQDGDQLNGFFIQEEDADADADSMTSEGIFVYCDTCPTAVAVGDQVDVTGLAVDFFGMTQIDLTAAGSVLTVVSSANPLPSPAAISLPAANSTEAETTFENVEGMLVQVNTTLVVSEYFEIPRYGQLVLTANSRTRQFTETNEPDVAGYAAFLTDLNRSRIILDDDNNIQSAAISGPADEAYFWPRPGTSITNFVRGGDQIDNLQGVMHWSFAGQSGTDSWRIRPVQEAFTYDFTSVNTRTSAPDEVGGTFKVASFNVLNYFTTLNERGANSVAELDRQRAKIASAICALNADVIGLVELENNGVTAINDLLNGPNGVNAQCGSVYAAIDTGAQIGLDAISVGFIYNTATVTPQGAYAILDSSVNPLFNDDRNRPVLAQTFTQSSNGGAITVAVNHLKSKGSSCDDIGDPDTGDGSGNCNLTRTDAMVALMDWLATDPTASGDEDFLIIGDLNAYRNETPIDAVKLGADDTEGTDDDFVDLLELYQGASAYSFVFDGQIGSLDHALSSESLTAQVTGATSWHINADEASIFDYNDGIQDPTEPSFARKSNALPIYEANMYRASDHDPLIVGLNLGAPPVITCPTGDTLNNNPGECGAIVSFPDPTVVDPDGDLVSVVQTMGPPSGSLFPIGDTTVEFTATDSLGHVVSCSFVFTVIDNEAPVASCANLTIALDGAGMASIVADDIDNGSTDNCAIASISASQTSFDCSNVGDNNVTLTVIDDAGNSSSCVAIVTVVDDTPPVAICMDITVQLDAAGIANITATDIDGGSSDLCGIDALSLDMDTFTCDDIGINAVTLTVTDLSGNSSVCVANVTVEDNIEPVLICMDINLSLDENGQATIVADDLIDSLSDACGIQSTAVDVFEFDCDDLGNPVTVTVTATDTNGNTATCAAVVTVVDDLAPVLTCPADITVDPGAGNPFYELPDYFGTGEATATDNCTDPLLIFTQDPAPGAELTDGTYTISLTAEDEQGNVGSCDFELVVETVLGVNDLNDEPLGSLVLYPNPSQDQFYLSNPLDLDLKELMIYDIAGRLIQNIKLKNMGSQKSVDINSLASATYVVVITSNTGQTVKQLIKE